MGFVGRPGVTEAACGRQTARGLKGAFVVAGRRPWGSSARTRNSAIFEGNPFPRWVDPRAPLASVPGSGPPAMPELRVLALWPAGIPVAQGACPATLRCVVNRKEESPLRVRNTPATVVPEGGRPWARPADISSGTACPRSSW